MKDMKRMKVFQQSPSESNWPQRAQEPQILWCFECLLGPAVASFLNVFCVSVSLCEAN